MSDPSGGAGPGGAVLRVPQNVAAGLGIAGLGIFGIWATGDLSRGTLGAMGPGMLPHWVAVCVTVCGVALALAGFARGGEAVHGFGLRGPVVVALAILAFAVTIGPFPLG